MYEKSMSALSHGAADWFSYTIFYKFKTLKFLSLIVMQRLLPLPHTVMSQICPCKRRIPFETARDPLPKILQIVVKVLLSDSKFFLQSKGVIEKP